MSETITVVGTGLMGSAVAKCFARAGHRVTAWNRTRERMAPLSQSGIVLEPDLPTALRRSRLLFLIVASYEVAQELLQTVTEVLADRVVVNGVTGTGLQAREMAEFISAHGGAYLDAGIMCYPLDIGGPAAMIKFGGHKTAWEQYSRTLLALGGASGYLGSDPALPNVTDAAMAGAFYNVALGAYLEAASFGATVGLKSADLAPIAIHMMGLLGRLLRDEATPAIDRGRYETDQATLDVYIAAVRHWREELLNAGQRCGLMSANLHNLEVARAAGYGGHSIYTQFLTNGVERKAS